MGLSFELRCVGFNDVMPKYQKLILIDRTKRGVDVTSQTNLSRRERFDRKCSKLTTTKI